MLNSLLQYFERIEYTQAQMFKRQKDHLSLDVDVINIIMTSFKTRVLMNKIFVKLNTDILIIMKQCSLAVLIREHIELVHNFIIENNNFKFKGLYIKGGLLELDATFTLDDAYSLHLLAEMMTEVECVEFFYEFPYGDRRVVETLLKKLATFLQRKSVAENNINLKTLVVRHPRLTDFQQSIHDVTSFLKHLELKNVDPREVACFLSRSNTDEYKTKLQSLTFSLVKAETTFDNRRMSPALFKFIDASKIHEISFANSFISTKTVGDMVNAGRNGLFWPKTLETLVLCGVSFFDWSLKDEKRNKELLFNISKLIALIPNVYIGKCNYLCFKNEDMEILRSSIKSLDEENGGRKAALISFSISVGKFGGTECLITQDHIKVCSVCDR